MTQNSPARGGASKMIPIYAAPPHADILPHSYVVRLLAQHCQNCGTIHEFSELYAKTHMKAAFGTITGKTVTNLRRLGPEGPQYNLPIELLHTGVERLAFCHECHSTATLEHLPPVPHPKSQTVVGSSPDSPEPGPKAQRESKKPVKSLADIDKLFE